MKKLLLALIVVSVLTGIAHSGEILIACGDSDYPPFTYKKGEAIVGVAPDVLTIIFGELGIQVDSRYVGNWKRCQSCVKSGRADILMGAYITEERKTYAAYTETPLSPDPQAGKEGRSHLGFFYRGGV